jgi:hypothetical protein
MRKQPDFQRLFFEHFGGVPRRVAYEIREDSNRYHDMIFLTSLVHDARFRRETVRFRGKRLSIPINRDCWELGTVNHGDSCELYVANGRLDISPVVEVEWRFQYGAEFSPATELWILCLVLVHKTFDTMELTIDGEDWACVLIVKDENLRIMLRDLEVPHLYSQSEGRTRPRP